MSFVVFQVTFFREDKDGLKMALECGFLGNEGREHSVSGSCKE
jgi:hypothetical protein